MAPIVFTPQVKAAIAIAVVLLLIAAGIWIERGQQAKKEVKTLTAQADFSGVQSRVLDSAIAEKINTEGAARKELNRAFGIAEQREDENPTYADYLDAPLPAESVELYQRAGEINYQPPGADGDSAKRSKADRGVKDGAR